MDKLKLKSKFNPKRKSIGIHSKNELTKLLFPKYHS